VHAPVGRCSFDAGALVENAEALMVSVIRAKPAAARGRYVRSVTVSSTMGPGVKIDAAKVDTLVR
jgi:large subunit ribosomal protein L1